MAITTHTIPKHPTNPDQTLGLVLDDVVFMNAGGYKLVSYEITADKVVLNYEP